MAGQITGMHPSPKNPSNDGTESEKQWESLGEKDMCYILDFDPDTDYYIDHPFKIRGDFADGTQHTYIPDFQVKRRSRNQIIECKPDDKKNNPEVAQQRKLGTAWAKENDHVFTLITNETMRQGHLLEAVKVFWRYRQIEIPKIILGNYEKYLQRCHRGVSLQEIASHFASVTGTNGYPFVYSMLFHHLISTDFTRKLTLSSPITLSTSTKIPELEAIIWGKSDLA